jgi:hypothetical protein
MFSLYFKAYKNKYKELAFIILFILLILYIPFLSIIVFILIFIQRFTLNIYSPLQYIAYNFRTYSADLINIIYCNLGLSSL